MSVLTDLQSHVKPNAKILTDLYNKIIRINEDTLFSSYPDKRLLFPMELQLAFYKDSKADKEKIKAILRRSSEPQLSKGKISGEAFNSLLFIHIHHFRDNKKVFEMAVVLMGMYHYASLHHKYYEHLPNEAVMKATINSLDETHDIVKYKTIFMLIRHKALSNHANMAGVDYKTNKQQKKNRFVRARDKDIMDYITGLYTRLNQTFRGTRGKFGEKHKDGEYFNTVEDNDVPEWVDERNMSQVIIKYATVTAMGITHQIDSNLVRSAANETKISHSNLLMIMRSIAKNEYVNLRIMCMDILGLFLEGSRHSTEMIKSQYFIDECTSIYKRNNTADARIIDLKNKLGIILENNFTKYNQLPREATKVNYRRAVYYYIVMSIADYR